MLSVLRRRRCRVPWSKRGISSSKSAVCLMLGLDHDVCKLSSTTYRCRVSRVLVGRRVDNDWTISRWGFCSPISTSAGYALVDMREQESAPRYYVLCSIFRGSDTSSGRAKEREGEGDVAVFVARRIEPKCPARNLRPRAGRWSCAEVVQGDWSSRSGPGVSVDARMRQPEDLVKGAMGLFPLVKEQQLLQEAKKDTMQ
jgi:hypothetical protein